MSEIPEILKQFSWAEAEAEAGGANCEFFRGAASVNIDLFAFLNKPQ